MYNSSTPISGLSIPKAIHSIYSFAYVLIVFSSLQSTVSAKSFFVKTNGNDALNGGSEANAFKTIAQARDAVRTHISNGMTEHVTVKIKGGTYYLNDPLLLEKEDSGRNGFRVTYEGYGGSVVIVGGKRIQEWQSLGSGLYRSHLPEVKEGQWSFNQLFDNNVRKVKARYPNSGYKTANASPTGNQSLRFDSLPTFTDLAEAQLYVWAGHDWFSNTLQVSNINYSNKTITTSQGALMTMASGSRYFLQGSLDMLDANGEFHLDRSEGNLYYKPGSSNIQSRTIIAPTVENIFQIKGQGPWSPNRAENITLKNLTLRITQFPDNFNEIDNTWNSPADLNRKGAISIENAFNIIVDNCIIENSGLNGISGSYYTRNCKFQNLTIRNCGYHGVLLAGTDVGQNKYDNKSNCVKHSLIQSCGKLVGHGGGVFIYQSGNNRILKNDIHDMPRYGICIKSMRYGVIPAAYQSNHFNHLTTRDNLVENNDIWDVINDSDDAGGVTLWGTGKNNTIRNNLIGGIHASTSVQVVMGIYLDDRADYTAIEKNLIHDITGTGSSPILIKGIHNRISHNIFSRTSNGLSGIRHIEYADEENHSHTLNNNIVYIESNTNEVVWSINSWTSELIESASNNVFWVTGSWGQFANIPGLDNIFNWKSLIGDTTSIFSNPLFVDPQNGDFTLQPGSPALGMGFNGININTVGR